MSVELKVVLSGDDKTQQDAFSNPNPKPDSQPQAPTIQPPSIDRQAPAAPTGMDPAPATPPPSRESSSTEAATERAEAPPSTVKTEQPQQPTLVPPPAPPPRQDDRLLDSIDALMKSIDALTEASEKKTQQTPRRRTRTTQSSKDPAQEPSGLQALTKNVESLVEKMGLAGTSLGNFVNNLTRKIESIGTRVSNVGSMVGNVVSPASTAGKAASEAGSAVGEAASGAATGAAQAAGGAAVRGATGAASGAAATGATAGGAAAGGATAAGVGIAASVAAPLVAVGLAAGATALSIKMLNDMVRNLASELEDLSPDIASVRANSSANMELLRLDRADRVGPEVAGLEASRLKLQEGMYEVQTKIYEAILKFSPIFELVLNGLNVGVAHADTMVATMNAILAVATVWDSTDDKPAFDALKESQANLAMAVSEFLQLQGRAQPDPRDPFLMELLMGNQGLNQQPPQRRPWP